MVLSTLSDWLTHLEALSAQRALQPLPRLREGRFDSLLAIAGSLDLLIWPCPIITVAGTNGKGSCVALLAAIFCAGGYRVGSFTSPHLLRYNERIQINQKPVEDALLCEALREIERARQDKLLAYFEFTMLVALWVFKRAKLDIIILEVGIGGRLDAVNMMDADVAIVSSIDLDHTDILGDTLEAIAFEKAGIMRSDKPCIWGDSTVPANVKAYAQKLRTPLSVYRQDFDAKISDLSSESGSTWTYSSVHQRLEKLPMPRLTYLPNAACVLQAVEWLQRRLPVTLEAIHQGLREVVVPGRFQVLEGKIKTILDVAHNPASARLLAKNLRDRITAQRVFIVIALLNARDIVGILSPLIRIADHWYLSELALDRTIPVGQLAHCLASLSVNAYDIYSSVEKAYKAAVRSAQPNDVILVMGSFYTVAAVMGLQY
jgi:dihydrofolate synthase/folylpolyglutamate synthase